MVDNIVKRLEENNFVVMIRSLEFDGDEYANFKNIIYDLKEYWRGRDLIEKRIVWMIFEIPQLLMNAARSSETVSPHQSEKIWDVALEIDALITELFYDESFGLPLDSSGN
jgi:hypothetical protein